MPLQFERVETDFVACFKVGDNLRYNATNLFDLVEAHGEASFEKLIVLQVASLLEAALAQIIYRAQHNVREGVPNMSEKDRREIEDKKVDKFNSIIDVLRKYKVLDDLGDEIYEELHKLRKFRNKVHIQEDVKVDGASRDEADIFTIELANWSLGLNIKVLRFLSEDLPRPIGIRKYTKPIKLPVSLA